MFRIYIHFYVYTLGDGDHVALSTREITCAEGYAGILYTYVINRQQTLDILPGWRYDLTSDVCVIYIYVFYI